MAAFPTVNTVEPAERWQVSMTKVEEHRTALAGLDDWMPYLDANSGLPGPRGNLELVAACAEEADSKRALDLIGTEDEFATVCGLVALGRHLGDEHEQHSDLLYRYAADPRWRVREGVAMALQRAGDNDPEEAFTIAEAWALDPDPLVRRAAVAAVCEPRLLRDPRFAHRALTILEKVTAALSRTDPSERRKPATRTLRQALGYGWSVAIAASPGEGLSIFRELEASEDPDVRWVVKENRKKARLKRLLEG
jgi:hypothetical protein